MTAASGRVAADESFAAVPIERVAEYWDARPCNIRHSPRPVGTREYFDEVEIRKYLVEPHIVRFAEFPRWRDKRVLEIGCGIGTDTINFARHGARVTAVDVSERSLAVAQRRAEVYGVAERVRFHHGNAEELSQTLSVEAYDLVYSFGVIHHTPHPERAVAEIKRFVHPESTLKIMVYHRRSWKVLSILLSRAGGRFWALREEVARHSEAQTGCPVTYTYTPREVIELLRGFEVTELWVDNIFPYRVADYVEYRYVKNWAFRLMPRAMVRWLERHLGWHLCVTAVPRP